MSAFKGTTGPWQLSSESPTIIKQDMSLIGLPDGGVLIGSAFGYESSGFYPTNEQAISNARLIAAAPELLAAAECDAAMDLPTEQVWLVLERHGWNREDRFARPAYEFVRRLRAAAIAKATGGAA